MSRALQMGVVAQEGGPVTPAPDDVLDIMGAQLQGWWQGGSWTESGGAISQLDDLSGNGRHMVQGTAANRPTTTTVGGVDAARFDPSVAAQYMTTSSSALLLGAAPHALFFVGFFNSLVSDAMAVVADDFSLHLRQHTGREIEYRLGGSSILGATAITTAAAVIVEDAGGTATIYVDNASDGSGVATFDDTTGDQWALGARTGGSFANDMTLLGAGMISGAITAAQRADLQTYWAYRYGL